MQSNHPLLIQIQDMLHKIEVDQNEIQDMLHKIEVDQKEVVFMWVPGHMGIRGNEAADRAAKEALEKEPIDDLMPFSDLKPLTAKYIHQVRQKEWDEAIIVSNKLHDIRVFGRTVLNRLNIGSSYFTDSFLLKKEEPPVCVVCNTSITVKHTLIECAGLAEIRKISLRKDLCIHCSEM